MTAAILVVDQGGVVCRFPPEAGSEADVGMLRGIDRTSVPTARSLRDATPIAFTGVRDLERAMVDRSCSTHR